MSSGTRRGNLTKNNVLPWVRAALRAEMGMSYMSTLSVDANYEFGFHIRIRTGGTQHESNVSHPEALSTKLIIAPEAIIEDEAQRRWWRLMWPFVSVGGISAFRWFLRLHGIW
jgi:hypothetical protein